MLCLCCCSCAVLCCAATSCVTSCSWRTSILLNFNRCGFSSSIANGRPKRMSCTNFFEVRVGVQVHSMGRRNRECGRIWKTEYLFIMMGITPQMGSLSSERFYVKPSIMCPNNNFFKRYFAVKKRSSHLKLLDSPPILKTGCKETPN